VILGAPFLSLSNTSKNQPGFQSEFTWANLGQTWHLDHTKALVFFDLTDPQQQALAVHHTNLQPLSRAEHIRKTREDLRLATWFQRNSI
jgi:hypothetical protein